MRQIQRTRQTKQTRLRRDRLGIRPLFYHPDGDRLVFASEIKALFVDPDIPRQLDIKTIGDIFTCRTLVGSETTFEGVARIRAGHYAPYCKAGMAYVPYWNVDFHETDA